MSKKCSRQATTPVDCDGGGVSFSLSISEPAGSPVATWKISIFALIGSKRESFFVGVVPVTTGTPGARTNRLVAVGCVPGAIAFSASVEGPNSNEDLWVALAACDVGTGPVFTVL